MRECHVSFISLYGISVWRELKMSRSRSASVRGAEHGFPVVPFRRNQSRARNVDMRATGNRTQMDSRPGHNAVQRGFTMPRAPTRRQRGRFHRPAPVTKALATLDAISQRNSTLSSKSTVIFPRQPRKIFAVAAGGAALRGRVDPGWGSLPERISDKSASYSYSKAIKPMTRDNARIKTRVKINTKTRVRKIGWIPASGDLAETRHDKPLGASRPPLTASSRALDD